MSLALSQPTRADVIRRLNDASRHNFTGCAIVVTAASAGTTSSFGRALRSTLVPDKKIRRLLSQPTLKSLGRRETSRSDQFVSVGMT